MAVPDPVPTSPASPTSPDAFRQWLAERLPEEIDPHRVLEIAAEGLGRFLRVTRVGYGEVEPGQPWLTVPLDWADGVASMAGRRPFPPDSAIARHYRAGEMLVIADTRAAGFDDGDAAELLPAETRAFVGVPLIRGGELVGLFTAIHREPRAWTDEEVQLIAHTGARIWGALQHLHAQARLHDSGEQFRTLADNIPGICWLADADGRLFWMNARGLDYHGSLSGDAWAGIHPDDRPAARQLWRQALASGRPLETSVRLRDRDGRFRPFLSRAEPIRDAAGLVTRWCGVQLDLSEQERRDRHDAFFRAVTDAIREETHAARILATVGDMLKEHLGVDRVIYSELDGEPNSFIVRHDSADRGLRSSAGRFRLPAFFAPLLAAYARGETVAPADVKEVGGLISPEISKYLLAGRIRAEINVPLVKEGRLVAILSVHHGEARQWTREEVALVEELAERTWSTVTRARAEADLLERERAQAFLIGWNDAVEGAMGADAILRTTLAMLGDHLGLARLTFSQWEADTGRLEVLGHWGGDTPLPCGERLAAAHLATAPLIVPDVLDHPLFDEADLAPYRAAGVRATVSVPLVRDGRLLAALCAFAVQPRPWTPVEVRLLCDVVERTWTMLERARVHDRLADSEAALERSRDALYQSEKLSALGSLLAGVSHELNNPLSIVVAQAVMMERHADGGELADRAQKIRKAADRCARIVQTFLAMARQKKPERTAVDLNAVATGAIELATYGLRADGVGITRALGPDLPRISADADQLHQIVTNLIVNAQQAMARDTGLRWLEVRTALGDEAQTVILEVADSGPGIPPDMRRRIFEPFYTTKAQGEGTGVGLSFSQGLAEAHGGRLTLVPSDRGACFRLTLPIDPQNLLPRVAPTAPSAAPIRLRRALIVDDEEEIAASLADFLSIEGFACDVAVGGAAAQARLADGGAYDLVVSDLRMPGVDGPALYAWIAQARPELAARTAFTTGDTLGQAAARFLADAGRPVLEKPFMPDSIRHFLSELDAA